MLVSTLDPLEKWKQVSCTVMRWPRYYIYFFCVNGVKMEKGGETHPVKSGMSQCFSLTLKGSQGVTVKTKTCKHIGCQLDGIFPPLLFWSSILQQDFPNQHLQGSAE